jgi:hypothetical protein
MRPACTYWIGITGSTTYSLTVNLNPDRVYLVTGGLILTDGEAYARVYIGAVGHVIESDMWGLGIRDIPDDAGCGLVEVLRNAYCVIIKLKTTGGKHRAEGVIYEL